jgi:phage minor structural protein
MIKIFEATDKIYTSNGDKIILPLKAKVHKQDNGDFYLDLEAPLSYIDYLVPNNIIVANTPQGDEPFRIANVENTRTKIKIKAYHVFYDSKNYLIQDSYVVDKNCNDALDHLNSSTDNTSPFTTISDITKIASYRCVRKSLYEAIQVLLERYGGHLYRDNWTIGIKASLGQDNGVTIRYGKNLKDIKATYDWSNVVTKLLPVGKDGILLNATDPYASVYLLSQTQYEIPFTKTVSFDQSNISEDDYKDEETGEVDVDAYTQALVNDLAEQGQNYIETNSLPVVNYTLSANVEKVSDIGDTIQVIDEKLGINLLTNIISYEYDCVLDKYTQIEFGNFTPTLSGLMNSITNQTQKIVDEGVATIQVTLGDELKEAQDKIWNALGSSYVIYEGDKILVVDSLPKETARNVIMINNGGIAFGQNGINGQFSSAWTIDNVLNMEQINVINLTADLIKGGTLKLGSNLNQNGQLEVYDEANTLIAELDKDGLKMYGVDGSYVLMNNTVGFAGYDRLGNQIYWVSKDEFHMKKSVVEEEITLCNKMRFIPIEIYDDNNKLVNDGIGLVSVAGGGN